MNIINVPLPYFNDRPSGKIDTLVFHCSAHCAKDMLNVLEEHKLSTHYIIDLNGDIYQTVADEKRAWHAGVSNWRSVSNINHTSIGIELSSLSFGQEAYQREQIDSLLELSLYLIRKYDISPQNIVAHSDVAPTRKVDPGIAFPWYELSQKGVGLWYDIANAEKIKETNVDELLRRIGYDTNNSSAAQYAFCRHFIPQRIIKIAADVFDLEKYPYPETFILSEEDLPILQACCYSFVKAI